jgi:ribosomal protein S18 acetylase RimI-like enzyme
VPTPRPRWTTNTAATVPLVLEVTPITAADAKTTKAVATLVTQLSSHATPPTEHQLSDLIASPAITLFGARDEGGKLLGILTLALFPTPTGVRAWIEDVVVDGAARGQGAATALIHAALDTARAGGARTVDLTSRPGREAANRLYQRVGFERRETNVYRYPLDA